MDDDSGDSLPMQTGDGIATRFSDEAREAAYQLWAFQYRGNAEKVSAALAKHDPPIKVDARSVQRWAKDGQWAIRKADDWRKIAPDLGRQTVIEADYGTLETAVRMREIVNDDTLLTIETTSPSGSVTRRQVPRTATKDRIAAGELLRKIGEFLRPTIQGQTEARAIPSDLRTMTDEQLREAERNG